MNLISKIKNIFKKSRKRELEIYYSEDSRIFVEIMRLFIKIMNHISFMEKNLDSALFRLSSYTDMELVELFNYTNMVNNTKSSFVQMILNSKSFYDGTLYKKICKLHKEDIDYLVNSINNIKEYEDDSNIKDYLGFEHNINILFALLNEFCNKVNMISFLKGSANHKEYYSLLDMDFSKVRERFLRLFYGDELYNALKNYFWVDILLNIVHCRMMQSFALQNEMIIRTSDKAKKRNTQTYILLANI